MDNDTRKVFASFSDAEIVQGIENGIVNLGLKHSDDFESLNTFLGMQTLVSELSIRMGSPTDVTKDISARED